MKDGPPQARVLPMYRLRPPRRDPDMQQRVESWLHRDDFREVTLRHLFDGRQHVVSRVKDGEAELEYFTHAQDARDWWRLQRERLRAKGYVRA